jgi:peptidyl-prolyl cis-trans isomerase C
MTSHIAPAKLPGFLKFLVLALVALTLAGLPFAATAQDSSSSAAPPAAAAPAPAAPIDPKAVVATVDGKSITEADLGFIAQDLGQQLQQVPQDQLRAYLLTQLIGNKLIAGAAAKGGLDQTDDYKAYIAYLTDHALNQAFIREDVVASVTPDQIKAEYDKEVAAIPDEDEVHARHILVSSEDDAKAIKAQLDGGADFATLAKAKSIEPGAKDSGGDLGYFKAGQMVKPFADAAFAMKVGEISQPVQTQFGWHIIKVEDRRKAAKPTLQDMTQQISQTLYVAKYRELLQNLRAAAKIDIPDAALSQQVQAQLGANK